MSGLDGCPLLSTHTIEFSLLQTKCVYEALETVAHNHEPKEKAEPNERSNAPLHSFSYRQVLCTTIATDPIRSPTDAVR